MTKWSPWAAAGRERPALAWAPLALSVLLMAYVGLLAVLAVALVVRGMAVLSGGGL